jgi:predicted DCC family thiol-disulfide oxidoreductase YuxK
VEEADEGRVLVGHRLPQAGIGTATGHNGSMANTAQPASVAERPVFLYDGDCSFCTTCARFIERRIPTGAEVTPWQFADLAELGVTQAQAEEAVIWVAPGRPPAAGPVAIARLLVDAGSFWRPLGWMLDLAPVRWVAWPVYRLIARNRHRLPGGTAACSLPQAERERQRAAG